jgi:GxxExxY protein
MMNYRSGRSIIYCGRLWLNKKTKLSCLNKQMKLNDITYQINGAIFEVNKILGPGFLEKVYENALVIELRNRGLVAESQVAIRVEYKNECVGEYIVDILVENKVVIEIKTADALSSAHQAQLLNYLKATGLNVGILVNFNKSKADIKRMVFKLPEGHDE